MDRRTSPYWAAQRTARASAVLLLAVLLAGCILVWTGYGARATQGQAQAETAAQAAPSGTAADTGSQPVQAPVPEDLRERLPQAAPSPAPQSGTSAPQAGEALAAGPPVADSWFSDAAFVGDSRTEGLLLYSGIRAGGGFAYRGLTVQSARTDPVIAAGSGKISALEALSQGSYAKVYLMLGVNELGWYNDTRYEKNYADLIDLVRQSQPQAQIYLQTLIPVTAAKSASSYVNNPQILVYNEIIARLAREKGVYLVDVWSAFADPEGALPAEGSVDGVHLTRAYYVKWLDYLKTHTAP